MCPGMCVCVTVYQLSFGALKIIPKLNYLNNRHFNLVWVNLGFSSVCISWGHLRDCSLLAALL